VCQSLVDTHGVTCAMADYHYSQDLGGCCNGTDCPAAYAAQAREVVAAVARLRDLGHAGPLYLGGHSAGGHLAVLLSLLWHQYAAPGQASPAGFFGAEGIYNVSQWDAYDETRWQSRFHCDTRQAFGRAGHSGWLQGSPSHDARARAPLGPILLVHSPQDDWVQAAQAKNLFPVLQPAADGRSHTLDVHGACAMGEHEDVIRGPSAIRLAACIAKLVASTPLR